MALARAQLSTRLMNVCLAALCRGGSLACAESVLVDAIRLGLPPHGVTYNTLVAAHCRAVGLDAGFAVLRQMREAGVDPDDVTYNSLIAAAARCRGLLMRALDLFDEMLRWDKWRNLSVTAGGYGSREKARMALKKGRRVLKVMAEPMDVDTNNLDDVHNTVIDAKPLAMAVEPMQLESTPENSVARLLDSVEIFYQMRSIFIL